MNWEVWSQLIVPQPAVFDFWQEWAWKIFFPKPSRWELTPINFSFKQRTRHTMMDLSMNLRAKEQVLLYTSLFMVTRKWKQICVYEGSRAIFSFQLSSWSANAVLFLGSSACLWRDGDLAQWEAESQSISSRHVSMWEVFSADCRLQKFIKFLQNCYNKHLLAGFIAI